MINTKIIMINIIYLKYPIMLISTKDKFIRNFSTSPVLLLLDDDGDENMDDPQSNSNSDSENETDPNNWHIPSIIDSLQGKSKDEVKQFFKDEESLIRAESKRHEDELAEDYKNEDEDWYNKLMEEEKISLENKLTGLYSVKDDVFDSLEIEESPSPSPSASSDNPHENRGSLIDDYADPNQFPSDWTGGDD